MKPTKDIRREAKQLFRLCLVDGVLDEARVRKVVEGVLASRPRGYLPLLKFFERWVRLEYARHTADVDSAVPLPFDLAARVRAGVEQAYGPGMMTRFATDPALIGGMRIQVGSDVYDGSIRSELAALAKVWGIPSTNGWDASA
ncbi:MAG TPA: F0F1 ATP synthase subunit delta [Terriglobales bacterium]|nr:F0F1 ATP synthase subunit delta [Terriglobales bacterium]